MWGLGHYMEGGNFNLGGQGIYTMAKTLTRKLATTQVVYLLFHSSIDKQLHHINQ